MVKKIISVFIIMILCSNVMAQEETELYTENAFNGKMWKELSENDRFCYLRGIHEAMKLVYRSSKTEESSQPVNNLSQAITVLYTPSGLTFKDISAKIDEFYKDSIDEKVPVFEVYALVCKENFALEVTENVDGTFDREKLIKEVSDKY